MPAWQCVLWKHRAVILPLPGNPCRQALCEVPQATHLNITTLLEGHTPNTPSEPSVLVSCMRLPRSLQYASALSTASAAAPVLPLRRDCPVAIKVSWSSWLMAPDEQADKS